MTQQRKENYLWVTWLSKLMAGDAHCQWAAWFKTHYQGYAKVGSDFNSAKWQAQHSELLSKIIAERLVLGEAIRKEDQNSFKVRMTPTLTLAGRPDLVTIDQINSEYTIYDAKTGKPRQSDLMQVMLYMLCLPAMEGMPQGKKPAGCVVYKGLPPSLIPPDAITPEFRGTAKYFVNILDSPIPPPTTASPSECRFCDITRVDCRSRVEGERTGAQVPLLEW